ncbi:hypothetical protein [Alkalihalobacterium bogoriense]|uniref:hypothetical protein n=1 Tax=Alkalihalobacterium bogoriense TaxID=246272 RepID=UPI00047BD42B|nr:hypothetical protein [Alkalihalobacterium bogoriense]
MILFILVALILIFDGIAIHFHKTGKMAFWLSGILMGFLAPIVGFSLGYLFLQLSRTFDSTSTHEGAGYAGAFIFLGLLANAIVFFFIGIIIKIFNKHKSEQT